MRQSAIISNATSNVQKDLLSQPLQLLSGVDILGNASSALEHMSKGAAAISMDKKFIQSRQRQVCMIYVHVICLVLEFRKCISLLVSHCCKVMRRVHLVSILLIV